MRQPQSTRHGQFDPRLSNALPTGLLVIVTRYGKRIKEDSHCILECYSVLAPVGLRLYRIPLKVVSQSRFHMTAA